MNETAQRKAQAGEIQGSGTEVELVLPPGALRPPASSPFPFRQRPHPMAASGAEMLLYVFFLAGCSTVLLIATTLRADPHGHGTHRAIGFPPCTMVQWMDTPCAFCGMTTCFTLCAGGRWLQAFVTQPFGVVLYLLTVTVLVGSVYGLVRRFSWMEWLSERMIISGTTGLLAMMLVAWVYKIIVYKNHWVM